MGTRHDPSPLVRHDRSDHAGEQSGAQHHGCVIGNGRHHVGDGCQYDSDGSGEPQKVLGALVEGGAGGGVRVHVFIMGYTPQGCQGVSWKGLASLTTTTSRHHDITASRRHDTITHHHTQPQGTRHKARHDDTTTGHDTRQHDTAQGHTARHRAQARQNTGHEDTRGTRAPDIRARGHEGTKTSGTPHSIEHTFDHRTHVRPTPIEHTFDPQPHQPRQTFQRTGRRVGGRTWVLIAPFLVRLIWWGCGGGDADVFDVGKASVFGFVCWGCVGFLFAF